MKSFDRNGVVLAIKTKQYVPFPVIHSQITQPQEVIQMLVKELDITEEAARKRVEKVSPTERVKTNVDKETGDRIREYNYSGVKVDEDYKKILSIFKIMFQSSWVYRK